MSYRDYKNDRSLATGLIDPENQIIFSTDPGGTTFSHTAGGLQFVDGFTDPANPVVVIVDVPARSNVPVTNLATSPATFVYFDINGDLVQEIEIQGGAYLRDHVGGTILAHFSNTVIETNSNFTPTAISNIAMGFADLSFAMGNISTNENGRNRLSGVSATTTIQKATGSILFHGLNCRNENKSGNIRTSNANDGSSIALGWTTTDAPFGNLVNSLTGIDPAKFDDGTAVFADPAPKGTVDTNEWVNHRVFTISDTDGLIVQYGVRKYPTSAAARIGIASESFEVIPVASATMATGTVTLRGGATDTTNPDDCIITQSIPLRQDFR